MMLMVNADPFEYRDDRYPGANFHACRLRVWQGKDRNVVVMTDLGDDAPGASVTNTVETIATEACKEYDLDPEKTFFVEHYERERGEPDTFDVVTFTWYDLGDHKKAANPQWRRIAREEIDVLDQVRP